MRSSTRALLFSLVLLGCGGESLLEKNERISTEIDYEFCRCSFVELGYASESECRTDVDAAANPSEVEEECFTAAFEARRATLAPTFECETDANVDYLMCVRAASCEEAALDSCDEASSTARDACPTAPDGEINAFAEDGLVCIGERLVGPAEGGCPNETVTLGAELRVSTVQRGDDNVSECGGDGAADVTVAFTAGAAGNYVFSTVGSDFDTVLSVLDSCEGVELDCDDDGAGRQSSLELELEAGQSVVVVIDGFNVDDAGDARLNITAL